MPWSFWGSTSSTTSGNSSAYLADRSDRAIRPDGGYSTPAVIASVGLALMFFVAIANLIVFQYAQGVVRTALDEGVRAESPAEAPAGTCQTVAAGVMDDLLRGPLGDGVTISCATTARRVTATATGALPAFAPWVPDLVVTGASATAVKEQLP